MNIGTNGPHYPGYAPFPLSANLAHHGEYDNGKNYNVTGIYEGGFISGLGIEDLPTGEYLIVNDSDSNATVHTMSGTTFTVTWGKSVRIALAENPIAFVVKGAEAHRVGIYPPGSLPAGVTNPKHGEFYLNQHARKALAPFASFRWNPQAVNGSSSLHWKDVPNDWNNPHTHLAMARQLGKPTHVQTPHLWTIDTMREYLTVLAEAMVADPTLPDITIERGNEIWNSGGSFRTAHLEVGAMYGYNLPGYNSEHWVLAWTGYGKMVAQTARLFMQLAADYPDIFNKRIKLTIGSQASNDDVTRQVLKAAQKEFAPFWVCTDSLTVAPYLSLDGGLGTRDIEAYYRTSIENHRKTLPKQEALAEQYGLALDCYEGGPDSQVRKGMARYSEVVDFETKSPVMRSIMDDYLAMLKSVGFRTYHHYQIVNSPSDTPWRLMPSCYNPVGNVKYDALLAAMPPAFDPADLNQDGVVDHGDIQAFSAGFVAGKAWADFNKDGVNDNGDIGAYLTEFFRATGGVK